MTATLEGLAFPQTLSIFRGTMTEPAVIDYPSIGQHVLSLTDHAHDFGGLCIKNRFGARCGDSEPVDHEAEVIDFVKAHLGVDLQPWQEDFLKAVVAGSHPNEHKLRHVKTGRYESATYGFFSTAQSTVNHKNDPSEWEIVSRPAFPFRSMK